MTKYCVHFSIETQLNSSECAIKEDIRKIYGLFILINED